MLLGVGERVISVVRLVAVVRVVVEIAVVRVVAVVNCGRFANDSFANVLGRFANGPVGRWPSDLGRWRIDLRRWQTSHWRNDWIPL